MLVAQSDKSNAALDRNDSCRNTTVHAPAQDWPSRAVNNYPFVLARTFEVDAATISRPVRAAHLQRDLTPALRRGGGHSTDGLARSRTRVAIHHCHIN